ncbi:Nuclear receptor subfamily 2 group C member [Trichinella pseudospiralis]
MVFLHLLWHFSNTVAWIVYVYAVLHARSLNNTLISCPRRKFDYFEIFHQLKFCSNSLKFCIAGIFNAYRFLQ